jgi:hypothetical protein
MYTCYAVASMSTNPIDIKTNKKICNPRAPEFSTVTLRVLISQLDGPHHFKLSNSTDATTLKNSKWTSHVTPNLYIFKNSTHLSLHKIVFQS